MSMARKKPEKHWRYWARRDGVELILVKGGRRAYLWVGSEGTCVAIISGPVLLRRLAKSILQEIPPCGSSR